MTQATAQTRRAEQRAMPLQTRLVPVAKVDAEARTFDTVWTTGARVRRFDWVTWQYYLEELSLDPTHIRMTRMENGAPVLNTHQQYDLEHVLGVVQRAWMEAGEGWSSNLFSDRDDQINAYWRDVTKGIIRNVSVGYIVHRYEKTDPDQEGGLPIWRAIDWEPAEISLVPVGADVFSGVRSLSDPAAPRNPDEVLAAMARAVGQRTFPCEILASVPAPAGAGAGLGRSEFSPTAAPGAVSQPSRKEPPMDESQEVQARGAAAANPAPGAVSSTPAAATADQVRAEERTRISGVRHAVSLARKATPGLQLDDAFENGLVERGVTVDEARREIFQRLESFSAASAPQRSAAAIETQRDEQEQRRIDMGAALSHRAAPASGALPDSARRYRGYTLFELARRSLEEQGVRTEGMSRNELVSLAMGNSDAQGFRSLHHTSDFSIALANTVQRSLRNGYTGAPRSFTQWARRGSISDFRPVTRVAMAASLALEKVNQSGEFKRGKMVDGGEAIQLATYGKVVGVSRQVVINDDLDFLARLPQMYGRAAADLESDTVYAILKSNPDMADGTALFHANHKNLGTAGVIGETALSEARKMLRLQVDPANPKSPLNLTGSFIIVGATKETEAQKMLAAIVVASSAANTNVFNGSYGIVVEPRLDATNPNEWFLAADPSQIDTIEYAYLEGEDGLYTETRMGFDVDGLEVKARLDFAAKAVDWRGLVKNPGA